MNMKGEVGGRGEIWDGEGKLRKGWTVRHESVEKKEKMRTGKDKRIDNGKE